MDIGELEQVNVSIDPNTNSCHLEKGRVTLCSNDIKVVWLRRSHPVGTGVLPERPDKKNRYWRAGGLIDVSQMFKIEKFRRVNVNCFVQAIIESCPGASIVSDPYAMNRSANKYIQLLAAYKAGLKTPDTIITNTGKVIDGFCKKHEDVVSKYFQAAVIPLRGAADLTIGTEALDLISVNKLREQVFGLPRIVQENVLGNDARITVIGDRVIGCRYEPKNKKLTRGPDYRNYFDAMNYYPISQNILENLRSKLLAFMNLLDIKFGTMDFKYDPKIKEFFFLEMNPSGQYLWPERYLGSKYYPAKRRTADYLRKLSNRS